MDKYEYKLRSEEIKSLIAKRDFSKAVDIADTIDWSRVRSVSTLCTISDLYKINRRYHEAKTLLQQAYERYPGGRTIVYSLCELCIKTDDVVSAIEYYKEFVQLAPTDNGKFILQYKIYEAQEVSLEERIAVLEELKKRDYREKWGYELAYLYHRIGLATKCVEECDELILWFREGKYVKKAMELKMLHQELSTEQQKLYQKMLPPKEQQEFLQQTAVFQGTEQPAEQNETPDIQVKTMDMGKYNTINLQKALAESMKEVLVAENGFKPLVSEDEQPGGVTEAIMAPMLSEDTEEILDKDGVLSDAAMQDTGEMQELFFTDEEPKENADSSLPEQEVSLEEKVVEKSTEPVPAISLQDVKEPLVNLIKEQVAEAVETAIKAERPSIREVLNTSLHTPDLSKVEPPSSMGHMLSQEYDGQISLVVPEGERIEKQITGQMNLEEVLAEWEKTKKNYEEKRKEEVKQRVLQQTGTMFTEFDAKVRDGILEKLEKETLDSSINQEKEENVVPVVKAEPEAAIKEEPIIEKPVEAIKQEIEPEPEELPEVEEIEEVIEDTEEQEEPVKEAAEEPVLEMDKTAVSNRHMSEEEVSLFAPFIQTKTARMQLLSSLDQISLAAYTGNVFVTGENDEETTELAKNVIRDVQLTDHNFSGKVAKVNAGALNHRDVTQMVSKLANGGLIIEKAGLMDAQTCRDLLKALNQEQTGIIVVLQDTKKARQKMMEYFDEMKSIFNVHIEVEELGDDALVAYGRKYANHLEYAIDEMGVLALHTRIDELQTSDHIVTVADVRDIVDEAIENASKKNLKHFADILFAKRYDDDDMIILRERDFLE